MLCGAWCADGLGAWRRGTFLCPWQAGRLWQHVFSFLERLGLTGAVGRSLARVRLSYRTTEEAMISERYLSNERSGNLRGCIGERMGRRGRGRLAGSRTVAQYVSS